MAGMAMYGKTELHYRRIDWMPLSIPISLVQGTIRSPEFRATRGEPYWVEVALQEGSIEREEMSCLLGTTHRFEGRCKATPSVVDLHWSISEGGHIVASGDSSDQVGGNSQERLLGEFHPNDGGPYVLELTVRRDGTALNVAHPQLGVVLDLFERDGLAMGEWFGQLGSFIVAGVGALILAICLIIKIKRRRQVSTNAT